MRGVVVILFACVAIYLGCYSFVLSRGARFLRWAALWGGLGAVSALAFTVLLILTEVVGVLQPHAITYALEWITFAFFLLWCLFGAVGARRAPAAA